MEPSGLGATPGGVRDALRAQRFLLPELLVAAAILAAGFAGILPFSATPFLLVFGVVSLWLRGEGARAVGLALRSDWGRTVLVGIGAGIGYQGFSLYVAEPAIARLTGKLPDVSLFAPLAGNVHFLLISLAGKPPDHRPLAPAPGNGPLPIHPVALPGTLAAGGERIRVSRLSAHAA